MTGEISLRGRVLPIGGLKEKTRAALRHGIHTVIIPADNQRDLAEIDQTVRKALHYIPVQSVETVLEAALHPINGPDTKILANIHQEVTNKSHQPELRQ